MIIRSLLLVGFVIGPLAIQNADLSKHVVRNHKNGQPYVVVYTQGESQNRVREELYFENGQLDYIGNYKNGREHGEWIYYWENGVVKSYEFYKEGREQGLAYDCDDQGKRIKEYHYLNGELVKEVDL